MQQVSRRHLLQGTAATLSAGSLLGACSTSSSGKNSLEKNEKVKLPTYQRYHGVRPDLPPTDAGVMAGFLRYPANPKSCTQGKPGNGGTVTALIEIFGAPPPGPPKNRYWASLNDALGVDLKLDMVLYSNMTERFAVTIAGNDLPDIVQLVGNVPDTTQMLAAKFQPITEFVSGDAVKDYPLLANLTTEQWKTTVYNGEIYGLPIPRERVGGIMYCREDIFHQVGANPQPASFVEFKNVCKQLTDPKKHRWAIGYWNGIIPFVQEMLGAPNLWEVQNGKFTAEHEDETFRQALSDARSLVAAGYVHPDAFTNSAPINEWFGGGTTPTMWTGYSAWTGWVANYLPRDPHMNVNAMFPPNYDSGSKANIRRGGISYSTAIFKKAKPERIKELLRIANWLASPFGTKEYLFRLYGLTGVDNTLDHNGDPQYTTKGLAETVPMPIRYVADSPAPIYQPGRPQDDKIQHTYQMKVVPTGIANPTLGLYSDTQARKGAIIDTAFRDAHNDILAGRKPLSSLDDALQKWRQGGGDQIRKEYEQQLQKQGNS